MRRTVTPLICLLTAASLLACSGISALADDVPQGIHATDVPPKLTTEAEQFFEQKIRPILVEQCYGCHSDAALKDNRLKGGLHVDSREGLLRGGDSGPAIVPKDCENSLLLKALRYDSLQMPPQGKLPAAVIADFERWIALGAADPRVGISPDVVHKQVNLEVGRRHWSYQPLRSPNVPDVRAITAEMRSPLDAFVLARLQAESIDSVDEADRTTLARRIYLDLLGLPPDPKSIDEFLTDERPDAFDRLVDRLLASPHFGIRWGRQWLSVARFAESLTLRGLIFPDAWRYRDYVIDSFNADLPFNRFVLEQLAGDLLPADNLAERQRQRIATTFLTLGNLNLEEQDKQQLRMDVVDEQLEAIGKGFLAQTIGCARCHDHKFDPIPTRDYYALAGILANVKTLEDANVSKWLELPLPLEPEQEAEYANHEAAIATVQEKIKAIESQRKLTQSTVVAAKDLPGIVVDDQQAKIVGDWQRSQSEKPYVENGYLHDRNDGKGAKSITLQSELSKSGRYDVRLAYTAASNRCDAVPVTVFSAEGETTVIINQKQPPPIDHLFVSLGQFRFEANGQSFVMVETTGTTGHVIVDAVQFLPVEPPGGDPLTGKVNVTTNPTSPIQNEPLRSEDDLKILTRQLEHLRKNSPRRPHYMSVKEIPQIDDIRVHIRGSVHNLGETVPRGFLQVAMTGESALPTAAQSGRRELGEWIANPQNPLTPRVISNRLWHWLFGAGLSRTPDNFGTTGGVPSHSELLDYLAAGLLKRNWLLKPTIREIVTSRTYRQSSYSTSTQQAADPENKWLSHFNRRRLDAECLLDAIVSISGDFNDDLGGSTINPRLTEDYGYQQGSPRRAVYWPVFRNSLPEVLESFDFADPSLPTGSRTVSTVVPQSLFFLNHSWVNAHARLTAQRLLAVTNQDAAARTNWLFRTTLGRLPTEGERQIVGAVMSNGNSTEDSWTMVVKALFSSIDFRYVE